LGEDKTGLISFLPIIVKLLVLVAVASIPMVQSYISDPLSPVIAIAVYVALRTARLITDKKPQFSPRWHLFHSSRHLFATQFLR
jgi:hypothetical protein